MTKLPVESCPTADLEHAESKRLYAHTFCRRGRICVCGAFRGLPETHRLGILLHEVGHLLAGQGASEKRANQAILDAGGVQVHYRDSRYGSNLEWVRPKDKANARRFLGLN